MIAEPIFCIIPPAQLIKAIADLGAMSASEKDVGLRLENAWSYCTLEASCNPSYSIGNAWISWFILYIVYSALGLYLEVQPPRTPHPPPPTPHASIQTISPPTP